MHFRSLLLLLLVSFASLRAQPTVEVARAALMRGDTTAAIAVLDQHLKTQPDDVPVLLLRSVAAEKAGELAAAVYFSSRALEAQEQLNPGIKPFPTTLARHRALFGRLVAAHPTPATAAAPARPAPASSVPKQSSAPPSSMVAPGQPAAAAGALQWAVAAKASSEYRTTNYGANQATGAPNVRAYGDSGNAWAPKTENAGLEWLELSYASPVRATGARVVQNFNPGAIVQIAFIDATGAVAATWQGPDATPYPPRQIGVLEIKLPTAAPAIAKLKLTLDTQRIKGWNAIDAVAILGEP
ncbi:MAG: hypothetical protein Q8N18_03325 [Opitutaceae bacterium]|nr:hypothetical protein [Opitutaceae bacterium]